MTTVTTNSTWVTSDPDFRSFAKELAGIRGVIFDGFGTLVQISGSSRAYSAMISASKDTMGARNAVLTSPLPFQDLAKKLVPELSSSLLESLSKHLARELDSIVLFDDVITALDRLRSSGLKICVGSNLAAAYAAPLKSLLAGRADAWVLSCEVGVAKPSPDFYQKALSELGTTAEQTLMVGDSLRCDVDGPRACGIRSLQIIRNSQWKHRNEYSLESLAELMPVD